MIWLVVVVAVWFLPFVDAWFAHRRQQRFFSEIAEELARPEPPEGWAPTDWQYAPRIKETPYIRVSPPECEK